MAISPNRERHLVTLIAAVDRQYAREALPTHGTHEGRTQAPYGINRRGKIRKNKTDEGMGREHDYSAGAYAPRRPECAKCGTVAVRTLWAYECGWNPAHSLTTNVRKPRVRTIKPKRATNVANRTTSGNRHANLSTQVWAPTPYEMAHGAKRVASREL